MLALANDKAATEGERDNALRMAHATLAKYNLELAQVEQHGRKPGLSDDEKRAPHPATFYGRPWARTVCQDVARMLFCEYLFTPATKAKNTRHYFVGRYSNAVSAGILSEFLVASITREGKKRMREAAEGNEWFRSFAWGAATAIRARVDALLRAPEPVPATAASPGTAIALASLYGRERAANTALIATAFPVPAGKQRKLGKRGKSATVADALYDGMQYGSTVSLNQQLGSKR